MANVTFSRNSLCYFRCSKHLLFGYSVICDYVIDHWLLTSRVYTSSYDWRLFFLHHHRFVVQNVCKIYPFWPFVPVREPGVSQLCEDFTAVSFIVCAILWSPRSRNMVLLLMYVDGVSEALILWKSCMWEPQPCLETLDPYVRFRNTIAIMSVSLDVWNNVLSYFSS